MKLKLKYQLKYFYVKSKIKFNYSTSNAFKYVGFMTKNKLKIGLLEKQN